MLQLRLLTIESYTEVTRGEINGKITIFERTIFETQKKNKMAGKKSAKTNNNDDKEECGSTKAFA